MTDQTPRPEPQDAGPGDSHSQVRAREPERRNCLGPLSIPLPVVGGGEIPQRRTEVLAAEFCTSWDGSVACGDVIAVITIAVAACRILAILVPLFMGNGETTREYFRHHLLKASRRHFKDRPEVFHESFASELADFVCRLPDNGVSRGEVEAMLSEVKWNSSNSSQTEPSPSSSPRT